MKDNNYIVIQGWMVNKLKLSGNELMVYAVIYGFSQDGESKYEGSGKYIADSLNISKRQIFTILDNLVQKGLINKTERFERNLKFCDYSVSPEFLPKEDNKKGDEETSPVMKYLPSGGGEETSPVVKNLPQGDEETSPVGDEKTSPHITNSYINHTTTSGEQPELIAEPPPQNEVEDLYNTSSSENNFSPRIIYTQDDIKNALLSVDKTLFLDNFYPQASAFMSKHVLDLNYLDFIYNETGNTNYKSFKPMFYTLFFKDNKADEYKALGKPSETSPPPPDDIKCPVCGTFHEKNAEECPNCSLPRDPTPQLISLFKELLTFPVERRNEYLKRENVIYSEFKSDFNKLKAMIVDLRHKFDLKTEYGFNLKTGHEEPSRSYHP